MCHTCSLGIGRLKIAFVVQASTSILICHTVNSCALHLVRLCLLNSICQPQCRRSLDLQLKLMAYARCPLQVEYLVKLMTISHPDECRHRRLNSSATVMWDRELQLSTVIIRHDCFLCWLLYSSFTAAKTSTAFFLLLQSLCTQLNRSMIAFHLKYTSHHA
eukprot:TRINITY_DN12488_c0_g1_i11.p3 TRINITY_DN12488_c0_g1~~TRINITY_DN12488_c0_g1_i11.p3  ORF type:complete len:161 (-),score=3.34 TRINITY_DN12488_c0_g1_i11:2396-2878(-)